MYKELSIQVIKKCNLDCPYCFANKDSSSVLSDEDMMRFISFCKNNKIDSVKITGGEPFLFSNISAILEKLKDISQILIFSNLTVPECISKLKASSCTILVNVNDRSFVGERKWKYIENNIETAIKRGFRIVLGKTFWKLPYEMNDIMYLLDKYNIKKLRVSQSSPKENKENSWSSFKESKQLYQYLYKIYQENLMPRGIEMQFDCPIPPCVIDEDIFRFFYKLGAIKAVCRPRVFLSTDLAVYHCYVTQDYIGGMPLTEFSSYENAYNYIADEMKMYRKNSKHPYLCSECYFGEVENPCGCFSFLERDALNEIK